MHLWCDAFMIRFRRSGLQGHLCSHFTNNHNPLLRELQVLAQSEFGFYRLSGDQQALWVRGKEWKSQHVWTKTCIMTQWGDVRDRRVIKLWLFLTTGQKGLWHTYLFCIIWDHQKDPSQLIFTSEENDDLYLLQLEWQLWCVCGVQLW